MYIEFIYDDGGREAAGFKGSTDDCVARSIAIATEQDYRKVYDDLNLAKEHYAKSRKKRKRSNSRTGVGREIYQPYLESLGWKWNPTMKIGSGCKVHLVADELPSGRLICSLSKPKYMTAVIHGTVHDLYDPSRYGERRVSGYYYQGDLESITRYIPSQY